MSLERYLPRSLRARFTLLVLACTAAIFLCTAPFTVWQGQQLLFEREIHDIQDRLDAAVSRGDSELRAIRQQAIAMTDVAEQWDVSTVEWINLKKKELGVDVPETGPVDPKSLDAWFEYMEFTLRRLPKAYGVRLAFEPDSLLGPDGVRALYVRRGPGGKPVRVRLDYWPGDSNTPGSVWYVPSRERPGEALDGIWCDPFNAIEADAETIITCSVPMTGSDGGIAKIDGVAAVDVTVGTIMSTLSGLNLAPEYQAFLLNPSRRITVSAAGGSAPSKPAVNLQDLVRANPDAMKPFSQLQNPANPTGWFVANNPFTGERSCFLFQGLPHNRAQLLYVIPVRAINGDVFWLSGAVLLLGLASMTGMGLLIRWSAGLVTSNLDVLRHGVRNVKAGNLREMLPPATSHDETADIIEAFNGMVAGLQAAFRRAEDLAREQQRAATELELARSIQQSALPAPIRLPGGRVFSLTLPAQQIGGDFYDHFLLPGGRVAMAVGDVSGKGVSAALFAVRASLLLRSAMAAMEPEDAVAQVNAMLFKSNPEAMFVTLFIAVWDPVGQSLVYVNAGHNPPFLLRSDGSAERLAHRSGPALGAMSGRSYRSAETPFRVGDLLAVFTDGISEAPDAGSRQFGEERLKEFLPRHREVRLDELARDVVDAVVSWQGGGERFDDITFLLARASSAIRALQLRASPATIEEVVALVRDGAREGGMDEQGVREISLAACEVATNIITHSLRSDPSRTYRVFSAWSRTEFMLRFEDDGPPFDPEALPPVDVHAPLEARPVGGLGWVLIRQAADSVRMDRISGTNILTLTRHRDRAGSAEKSKPL